MRVLCALALLGGLVGGYAAAREEPMPRGRPPSSAELDANLQQAIEFSSAAIVSSGHAGSQVKEATQLWPNYWRVRYQAPPKESHKLIDIYFDGQQQRVVREEIVTPERQ